MPPTLRKLLEEYHRAPISSMTSEGTVYSIDNILIAIKKWAEDKVPVKVDTWRYDNDTTREQKIGYDCAIDDTLANIRREEK